MLVRIRIAHTSDASAIAQVHVDSWKTTYRGIVPDDVLDNLSYERREEWWREVLLLVESQCNCVYVAEDNYGSVVGFAYGSPERENDPIYRDEYYAIYLLDSYQRKGVGQRLVGKTAQHLLKCGFDTMLVWVLADNPSRRFYDKLGGQTLREKEITIGDANLIEVAYGWTDIHQLAVELHE